MTHGNDSLLVLTGPTIREILLEAKGSLIDIVRHAYDAHAAGQTVLPHSVFLRLSDGARIIALPAYVSAPEPVLGLKWIGSFLSNPARGLERASSVMVLNCTETGRPEALLEGAEISAARTAASAALAVSALDSQGEILGVIGAGRISFDIVRYVQWTTSQFTELAVHDLDAGRARYFADRCTELFGMPVQVVSSTRVLLEAAATTVIATSAAQPHIDDLPSSARPRTVLHVSLRDLSPRVVAGARNIVDDADHVCRESTSLELAWKSEGHRDFIAGTLSDVVAGRTRPRLRAKDTVIFSPFGLGVLDVAVAEVVRRHALAAGKGTMIPDFIAPPMLQLV